MARRVIQFRPRPRLPSPQSPYLSYAAVAAISAIAGAALCWAVLCQISWHPLLLFKHIAAFPNCAAARAVGLAPSRRGEPGYWSKHDADDDGVACENFRRF
ncbi:MULTISPECIES: excalibur calcium-binding domain-containing protein [unclassified Bradyrhizobium]|uniref:excalibur calcium-binding domain-containing protein n=1 Tax=unclassified Bradyrhizobium TaxID=2631580 RepID=UPI0020A05E03|nr:MULTISPECIES: excalibur calcium-binding domain-containing protein [unclassified Bradyrhizobium]